MVEFDTHPNLAHYFAANYSRQDQWLFHFPNNWNASVIPDRDLYELAVLDKHGKIAYLHSIRPSHMVRDTHHNLTIKQVLDLLEKIAALPKS